MMERGKQGKSRMRYIGLGTAVSDFGPTTKQKGGWGPVSTRIHTARDWTVFTAREKVK